MKIQTGLAVLACCFLIATDTQANIINGDFATCDFTGWQKDTDGAGDVSTGSDFSIVNAGGNCSGVINVDHFDPAGDFFGTPLDDVFFANTLFQDLDFTGAADSTFVLELDFSVETEADSNDPLFLADFFLIGLNDGSGNYFNADGNLGLLFDGDITGANNQSLSFELNNSFVNQNGWSLDFQVGVGFDNFGFSDAFGSTLLVNNVSLTEVSAAVPEPSAMYLFSLGLIAAVARRRRN